MFHLPVELFGWAWLFGTEHEMDDGRSTLDPRQVFLVHVFVIDEDVVGAWHGGGWHDGCPHSSRNARRRRHGIAYAG